MFSGYEILKSIPFMIRLKCKIGKKKSNNYPTQNNKAITNHTGVQSHLLESLYKMRNTSTVSIFDLA